MAKVDPLAPAVVDDAEVLASNFQTAQPFRHLVVDGFFQPDFAAALVAGFPPFDTELARNENGQVGGKCTHERLDALGGPWQEIDRLVKSRPFLDWLQRVSGIDGLLYDPHYFGGGTHENRHGQDLDPHVDFNRHPITGWHRRLNLIVYLNEAWQPEWGGGIEFHSDPRRSDDRVVTVQPMLNRAVLFETTHWSWHGFERINLPEGDTDPRSRKSVALYFYSTTRPAEELVDSHSTIYVERPLPEHFRPGLTLTESDHAELVRLLTRRDQHLQRLYRNISELSARLDSYQSSRVFRWYRGLRVRLYRVLEKLGLRGSN